MAADGTTLPLATPERTAPIIARLREEFGRNCQQDAPLTWRFEVPTSAGRSHVVTLHVSHASHGSRDLSRFVAVAPIGPVKTGLPWESLLRKNSELDIGAIAIAELWTRDHLRLPFVVFRASHLVATADYPEIWELIVKSAEYADQLELDLYSRDTF